MLLRWYSAWFLYGLEELIMCKVLLVENFINRVYSKVVLNYAMFYTGRILYVIFESLSTSNYYDIAGLYCHTLLHLFFPFPHVSAGFVRVRYYFVLARGECRPC